MFHYNVSSSCCSEHINELILYRFFLWSPFLSGHYIGVGVHISLIVVGLLWTYLIIFLIPNSSKINTFDIPGTSIGKRYARTDELGVPLAITVDSTTSVTIRERDSKKQIRVSIEEVSSVVKEVTEGLSTWNDVLWKYPTHSSWLRWPMLEGYSFLSLYCNPIMFSLYFDPVILSQNGYMSNRHYSNYATLSPMFLSLKGKTL